MQSEFVPPRRRTLAGDIAHQLEEWISNGNASVGDRLPGHRQLAQQFGVSVVALREAISTLVGAGLLESRPGLGTFVTARRSNTWGSAAGAEILELIEARRVIEPEIAALAAERALADDVSRLEHRLESMRAAQHDVNAYVEADLDFHAALSDACHNRALARAMQSLHELLRKDIELNLHVALATRGSLAFSVASHARIVDAIKRRNPATARRTIVEIVRRTEVFAQEAGDTAGGRDATGSGEGAE